MKEEEFNSFIKNAVEDYESKSIVHFNKQKVWNNTQVKANKKRGFWFMAASLIIAFLSVAIWLSLSVKSENNIAVINNKPKYNAKNKIVKTDNLKTKNDLRSLVKPLKSDILIKKIAFAKADLAEQKIEELKIEFPQDSVIKIAQVAQPKTQKPVEEVFTTEFKRGKTAEMVGEKSPIISISFKKHKQSQPIKTETATAQVEQKNIIFKLKF